MTDVVINVIENPYHKAEIKPHHLDVGEARLACFDAFNIVSASHALGGEYEMADEGDDPEPSSLFRLHHALAEPRLSQLLLQIAVFVRTFDDVMSDIDGEAYRTHAAATNGEDYIGNLDGTSLTLREACNKIIHAVDFRPIYDHSDRRIAVCRSVETASSATIVSPPTQHPLFVSESKGIRHIPCASPNNGQAMESGADLAARCDAVLRTQRSRGTALGLTPESPRTPDSNGPLDREQVYGPGQLGGSTSVWQVSDSKSRIAALSPGGPAVTAARPTSSIPGCLKPTSIYGNRALTR